LTYQSRSVRPGVRGALDVATQIWSFCGTFPGVPAAGHGYPLRLAAPGRRGYWWVKWVDRIELQATPWWWQPRFPVT